ncbi:MAG: 3-oxoacyl-ACP reductase family protein [Deltaproteobacteria bacterium]|nr:3-oxoacyl-ACP reductase family protein [Deltaproteobacteria bacterium]
MTLKDKVAVVTGGGQGIGRAICEKLALEGAKVAIFELNSDTGNATVSVVEKGRALFFKTDCTKKGDIESSVSQVVKQWGKIDILVNNIGWSLDSFFVEEDEAYWDKVLAISLKAPILVAHACLKELSKQKGGKIVNIASDAGRVGQLRGVVYSAAKGGIIAFTKALAREVARYQLSVNCICPGPTDTQLYKDCIPDKLRDQFVNIIPFKRIAQPSEIAEAVSFFASPAADYITGQVLSVSGGLTMAG